MILSEINEIYVNNLKMESFNPNVISTERIQVLAAYIGINPLSSQYGYIITFFEQNGHTYRIRYQLHNPKDKIIPGISDIDEILFDEDGFYRNAIDTNFGNKAFWNPETTLDEDLIDENDMSHYNLRMIENKIKDYITAENLVEQLYKNDHIALEKNHVFQ